MNGEAGLFGFELGVLFGIGIDLESLLDGLGKIKTFLGLELEPLLLMEYGVEAVLPGVEASSISIGELKLEFE